MVSFVFLEVVVVKKLDDGLTDLSKWFSIGHGRLIQFFFVLGETETFCGNIPSGYLT